MNKYLVLLIAVLSGAEVQAQVVAQAPRVVITVTIDGLQLDMLNLYAPLYGESGFKKLFRQATYYTNATFRFSPVDRSSSVASLFTGSSPYYHNIIANKWLDRTTLRPVSAVDGAHGMASPERLSASTIGDELKIGSNGLSMVYSVGTQKDMAILSGGHAADGAFWLNGDQRTFSTSSYYPRVANLWLNAYRAIQTSSANKKVYTENDAVVDAALNCLNSNNLGRDNHPDLLAVSLNAPTDFQNDLTTQRSYVALDEALSTLLEGAEKSVGKDNLLFLVTGTGTQRRFTVDREKYKIPGGTFSMSRTANILNVYLNAVFGQGHYVEATYGNQIYLDKRLIEQKRLDWSDILQRSSLFLYQIAGVKDVFTIERLVASGDLGSSRRNGYSLTNSGDLIVELAPGWKAVSETSGDFPPSLAGYVSIPIFIYGNNIPAQRVTSSVFVEQLAATLATSLRIRAPNACQEPSLPLEGK